MERLRLYKFCPICGSELNMVKHEGKDHLKCSKCDFDFFLNPAPTVSAIISEGNKILLTKRANSPWKNLWEIPGGFVEKGETFNEALEREMEEELGIRIKDLKYFTSISDPYCYKETTYSTLITYFNCVFDGKIEPTEEVANFGFFDSVNLPDIGSSAHRNAVNNYFESYLKKG